MSGWPVRAGEFKTITHIKTDSIKDQLKYGIYRVFIEGQPAEQKCTRGFHYNPAGYYTHYDLLIAMDLGLHIELSSESPNALIFEQTKLINGHDIFNQWASYLTEIKEEDGKVEKVAKHMLVSLWGRLYSDGRRQGPHQHMAPFILAKGRKVILEKIRPLGNCVKRIHTDGFIISDKNTEQLIERYVGGKTISGVKFTNALSRNTKPAICAQVLGLKFIGKINIEPDVYISEVCKACPNLQWLSFENSGSRILNNKNLEALLAESSNLKRLMIRGSIAYLDLSFRYKGKDRQVSGSNKTLNDFKVIKKPKADLILGLPRLWLREAKIYVQKDGIRIYGDFVSFCKYPPKPKTSSSSNSESEKDDLELKKKVKKLE
ncbi:hypothetical protein RclHR1_00640022 [Rhizophagus clarus]|uniref:Uncharacterized protein n=1 Tax=Rhizophagus clarus TaxID=94130 RepID=A0A2Z6RSN2_9GLOM|nr:hypothetical protein RclHR1_00640022 [Rhizophagus clarus]